MVFYDLSCTLLSLLFNFYVLIIVVFLDYRHQDDENIPSRGSILMKTAILGWGNGIGLRFIRYLN